MAQLNGRVFTRLQQYDALPTELKREVEALEKHLTASQGDIFGSHRTLQLKSVYGVRTRPLLEKIEAWVKQHDDEFKPKEPKAEESERMPSPTHPPASNVANDLVSGISTPVTAPVEPAMKPAYSDPKVGAHIPRAKELLDALVLKGFVTPHKEDKPEDAQSATEDLEFKDNELLVARGKDVAAAKNAGPTVWDLADGAVFAGMVKRKTGLLESIVHGKDTYAVVNMRLKNLTLFSSDLALEPLAQFDATALRVSLDKSEFEHGVKVWTESESELLDVASQIESDALVQALLAVGASHRDNVGHGHKAATAAEQLRNEVKNIVEGENHEVHVSDPSASKKKNEKEFADYPATHEADAQHKGSDTQKTPEVHATQTSTQSHNSVITDGLHTASRGNDTIGQTNATTTGTKHETQPLGQSNNSVGSGSYPNASRGTDALTQMSGTTAGTKHETQPLGQSNNSMDSSSYPTASRGTDAIGQMNTATTGTKHETPRGFSQVTDPTLMP